MSTVDLVFEIGCEEIPHDLLSEGINGLEQQLEARLGEARLAFTNLEVDGTPRRLSAMVRGINARQDDIQVTSKGPSEKVALDAEGNPTRAGEGFARGQKVDFSELAVVDGYLTYTRTETGRATSEVLAELLPAALKAMHWSKAMHWHDGQGPFVRPIKWICAVLDGTVVPFEFAGVASDNQSHGHRFMAPDAIVVNHPDDYLEALYNAKVMLRAGERIQTIREQIAVQAETVNGTPQEDLQLIETTAYKTEWPVAVLGNFDPRYLTLPSDVLLTSMREHQDDFGVVDDHNALMPHFIAVADNQAPDMRVVAKGNERVLRARLEDARFFFEEDQKQPLSSHLPRLESFMFQKQLGSVADKVRRVTALTRILAPALGADPDQAARAAELCKCDLVTNMVYEFPELEGTMGRVYAEKDGEPSATAVAIEEHYLPRSAGDDLPASPEGLTLALADKLDTLVGIFGVGLIPSGSQDPYALRRAGLGIVRMLEADGAHVNLGQVVRSAATQLEGTIERDAAEVADQVLDFIGQRLVYHLTQTGIRNDVAQAVVDAGPCVADGFSNLTDAIERAGALDRLSRGDDFADLMTSFKRILKIIPKDFAPQPVAPEQLTSGAETALWDVFQRAQTDLAADQAAARLNAMAAIKPRVDAFFDAVLVNDPDETVRTNRLSMLANIRDAFLRFADFSRISVG